MREGKAMHAIEGKVHTQVVGSFVLKMDSRNCLPYSRCVYEKLTKAKARTARVKMNGKNAFRPNTTHTHKTEQRAPKYNEWNRNTRIQFLRILDSGLVSHGWEEKSCRALACVTCFLSPSLTPLCMPSFLSSSEGMQLTQVSIVCVCLCMC